MNVTPAKSTYQQARSRHACDERSIEHVTARDVVHIKYSSPRKEWERFGFRCRSVGTRNTYI